MKNKGNDYSNFPFHYILLLSVLEIIYVSCTLSGKYHRIVATVHLFLTLCSMTSCWLFEINDTNGKEYKSGLYCLVDSLETFQSFIESIKNPELLKAC